MMKFFVPLVLIAGLFFYASCAAHHPQDPNANILVTYSYEDGPEQIVLRDDCKPQIDCGNKSNIECTVALYNDAEKLIREGKKLAYKKLYLSAATEYLQASCRLTEARIRISNEKNKDSQDYIVVKNLGLETKIKEKIKMCEENIERYLQRGE
jgi:hypothetical protein